MAHTKQTARPGMGSWGSGAWGDVSSLGRHRGEGDLTVGGRELRIGRPCGVFGGEISASDRHQDDLDGGRWWCGVHLDLGFISKDDGWSGLGLRSRLGSVPAEAGASSVAVTGCSGTAVGHLVCACQRTRCSCAPRCTGHRQVVSCTCGWGGRSPGNYGTASSSMSKAWGRPWDACQAGQLGGDPGTDGAWSWPCRGSSSRRRLRVKRPLGPELELPVQGPLGPRPCLFPWSLVLFPWSLLPCLGLGLLGGPTAGWSMRRHRYSVPHKGKLIPAQQSLHPLMKLRGQVGPERGAVGSG